MTQTVFGPKISIFNDEIKYIGVLFIVTYVILHDVSYINSDVKTHLILELKIVFQLNAIK